ncbi:LytR C-terminal domain-containing protein [Herbiconiux liangxiaofengii]|uniref:LytR C-terminal domain-containing protein n=1 Tax=Herbiconiux liangxiaofengii TaxID=3342795 RepID=UPI0035B9F52B
MPRFPEDSFDRLPADSGRVGAHRGPVPRGRGWRVLAWAALATALLVAAGVIYLAVIDDRNQFTDVAGGSSATAVPTDTATEAPAVTPVTDGTKSVTILNGTDNVGLATRVGDAAAAAGWNIGSRANATSTDFPTTTVYYADAANEAAALGLAQLLGGVPTELNASYPGADLTAVLGTDYAGPGLTESAPVEETPVDEAPVE